MPTLKNLTKAETLAIHVEKANNLLSRMKGLLGRTSLDNHHTLWILNCNSIHTFFMKFSIDAILSIKPLL